MNVINPYKYNATPYSTKYFDLDGSNEYFRINNNAALNSIIPGVGDFTMIFQIIKKVNTSREDLFGDIASGYTVYPYMSFNNLKISLLMNGGSTYVMDMTSGNISTIGNKYWIAIRRDYANAANNSIRVNGVEATISSTITNNLSIDPTPNTYCLGNGNGFYGEVGLIQFHAIDKYCTNLELDAIFAGGVGQDPRNVLNGSENICSFGASKAFWDGSKYDVTTGNGYVWNSLNVEQTDLKNL